jgi:hypothetical protein
MSTLLIQPGGQRSIQVARAHRAIDELIETVAFAIEIKRCKKPRTNLQNRTIWGLCYETILRDGGEELQGWDKEDLHEFFMGEWGGWEVVEAFGKKRQRPIRRSSKLNTAEFASYFDFIQRRAAEFGIYIADPDKHWNVER